MHYSKSVAQWQTFIQGCLDFRPVEGIYRIAREMFTEPELFDLEMETDLREKLDLRLSRERDRKPHDYITMQAGRQPLIITRGAERGLECARQRVRTPWHNADPAEQRTSVHLRVLLSCVVLQFRRQLVKVESAG